MLFIVWFGDRWDKDGVCGCMGWVNDRNSGQVLISRQDRTRCARIQNQEPGRGTVGLGSGFASFPFSIQNAIELGSLPFSLEPDHPQTE